MVTRAARFSVSAIVALLLTALCFVAFPQSAVFKFASASSTLPVGYAEYANGTITVANSPLSVWYDWVNVSGTQVINYFWYANSDYPYPVPIANLVGQHLRLADGSEVFVASALDKMEVYSDLNGDGIPQANFTSGDSEILYLMYFNMSVGYRIIPIQKTIEGGVPHFRWGFAYTNVYAFLQNETARFGVVARLIFDHITVSYDFSVNGNVSNLKANFDIGKVTILEALGSSQVSLNGLGLALLYTTSTYTSKPYATYVNNQPYNSTTAQESAVNANIARIAVGDTKAYDFVFGGNYTLNRDANNETHEAKAEAAALSSLPISIYRPIVWQTSVFRDLLHLSDLFGGSWPELATDYNASSLLYRICFPVWDGMQIEHDPVYVAYLSSSTAIPEFPTATILSIFITATSLILVMAKMRKHKSVKQNPNA